MSQIHLVIISRGSSSIISGSSLLVPLTCQSQTGFTETEFWDIIISGLEILDGTRAETLVTLGNHGIGVVQPHVDGRDGHSAWGARSGHGHV